MREHDAWKLATLIIKNDWPEVEGTRRFRYTLLLAGFLTGSDINYHTEDLPAEFEESHP